MEVFTLPVLNRTLVYAPLDHVLLIADAGVGRGQLGAVVAPLVGRPAPMRRTGPMTAPSLLGLIPTRGCTMACPYCDFGAPKRGSPVMTEQVARRAIDAYLGLVLRSGTADAHLHFFGGEPFHAPRLVRFATGYARELAARVGVGLHVEATSNGLYSPSLCEWIAHNLDAVVLSFDGPPDILDRHRPGLGGRSVADVLLRSARRLSDGPVELHLRACVTAATVARLPEIAAWFAAEFRPVSVCFETIHAGATPLAGFTPPDPWDFAAAFLSAEEVLAAAGVRAVMATAETGGVRSSFCPVGSDALIVSPDGAVDACYLLEKDWRGLDLRLGQLGEERFDLDDLAVQRARDLTVENKTLCRDCFCRWHCAGGCHVNHRADAPPGAYDRLCVQTRIVTLHRLLRQAGEPALAAAWLASRDDVAVLQPDDRLDAVRPFAPTCLTLYPNGDCNLRCSYCFSQPVRRDGARLTGEAVTAAAQVVAANCAARGVPLTVALHGGGEPALHTDLVEDLLGRVEAVAAAWGLPVFRYIATNGVMPEVKAAWLAHRVDLVGLSSDGPPDLQDAQRPTWEGRPTSPAVERTARVLRDAGTPFHVRVTVTGESCTRQEEIAEYLCGLGAAEVHVEPVYRVGRAAAGQPLDPAAFVRHFLVAQEVARGHGVRYLTSGSRVGEVHGPHCNVLRQVLQLVPGDVATSCFAVADAADARRAGLVIGGWDGEAFTIDDAAVRRQQERLAVLPTACQTCVARHHCAGACPEGCALTGRIPPDSKRCEVNRLLALAGIRQADRLRNHDSPGGANGYPCPPHSPVPTERTGRQ